MRFTRDQVVKIFGEIDFKNKVWPDESKHMQILQWPDGFEHVTDSKGVTNHKSPRIYCNKAIAGPLYFALEEIVKRGLADKIKTFDGCFNIRMTRGTVDKFSAHSYGLAVDLNASENPLGASLGGFYSAMDVVQIFRDHEFFWGGDFHGRKDPQHFSWSGF